MTAEPAIENVFGRIGFGDWSGSWPHADPADLFAAFINAIEKFVASRAVSGNLGWNATLIEGDIEPFLTELKNTPSGEISLFAGISLVRQLFFSGVLDELTLMVHPVVAGTGRHLFEHGDPTTRLELVKSTITSAGNALLTYSLRAA
ncbi:dihydrofolate reductase family protein [Mycetocola sp. 2940]|uniref:dihydrofolate reductase family protein n=1 Tax=Mycetocola sp. 2940 TaxID=3156452 RepID=UPI0033962788